MELFVSNRDGGMKGLFMGVAPRVGRAGPSVGIVVSSYEVVKYFLYYRHLTQWLKVTHSLIVVLGFWFTCTKLTRFSIRHLPWEGHELWDFLCGNHNVPVMVVERLQKQQNTGILENKRSSSWSLGMPGFKVFPFYTFSLWLQHSSANVFFAAIQDKLLISKFFSNFLKLWVDITSCIFKLLISFKLREKSDL